MGVTSLKSGDSVGKTERKIFWRIFAYFSLTTIGAVILGIITVVTLQVSFQTIHVF